MGRFAELNGIMQSLALDLLRDKDLCKLIYYPDTNITDKPDVNGIIELYNKRLLIFNPKVNFADEVGTFVNIKFGKFMPSSGGNFIISLLYFEVWIHNESRNIRFKNSEGKILTGDRGLFIIDRIDELMNTSIIGIGKSNLYNVEAYYKNDNFNGYIIGYNDVSFRSRGN